MELKGGGAPPPGQQTKMSGTISPRARLQLWVNTFLLKQKENSGSVTATFRDFERIHGMNNVNKSNRGEWLLSHGEMLLVACVSRQ